MDLCPVELVICNKATLKVWIALLRISKMLKRVMRPNRALEKVIKTMLWRAWKRALKRKHTGKQASKQASKQTKKCLYTSKMANFRTLQFLATPF